MARRRRAAAARARWAATAASSLDLRRQPRRARVRVARRARAALSQVGPATPDHTIYTKRAAVLRRRATGPTIPQAVQAAIAARGRAVRRRLHGVLRGAQPLRGAAHRSVPARRRSCRASACSRRARTAAPPASSATSTTTRSSCWAPPARSASYVSLTRAGRLRRRVLAARALQADPGAAGAASWPAAIALVTGGGGGHRTRRRPAARRRGRARGGRAISTRRARARWRTR